MGTKLNHDERLASMDAFKRFYRKYGNENAFGCNTTLPVKVLKNGVSIYSTHNMPVSLQTGDINLHKIYILWEEAGLPNYHENGLFGGYQTDYCPMTFDGATLIIPNDNGIIIYVG